MLNEMMSDTMIIVAMGLIVVIVLPVVTMGGILCWQLRKELKWQAEEERKRKIHAVEGP